MVRMDENMPFLLQYENVAWYDNGKVRILDRRVYPTEVRFVECTTYQEVVKAIEVYGEMHRFIPFLAKQAGFGRIGEKVVDHRARKYGSSKFGLERTVKGYLDLITVLFMTHFGRSPMYFFGSLGTLMFLMGGGTTVWIIAEKLWKQSHALPLRAVTDQPLFYLAILAVILGVQLFLAGFLGELINRGSSERNKYLIDKTL